MELTNTVSDCIIDKTDLEKLKDNSLLPIQSQSSLMLNLEAIIRIIELFPVNVIQDFWHTDKCRIDLLPYLAGQLGIDFWEPQLLEATQRGLCQNALTLNKHRGTIGSLKLALSLLDAHILVREWFQYDGEPGTGKVIVYLMEGTFSASTFLLIANIIEKLKRLSCHFTITTDAFLKATLPYVAGGGLDGDVYYINMEESTNGI